MLVRTMFQFCGSDDSAPNDDDGPKRSDQEVKIDEDKIFEESDGSRRRNSEKANEEASNGRRTS